MSSSSSRLTPRHPLPLGQSIVAQYLLAFVVVAITLKVFSWYTVLVGSTQGLSILNRTMSSGTLFLLGFLLLFGPFSRVFGGAWSKLFILRKEIGVLTFFTGLLHVYLSMFPLARNGPWGFYVGRPWSAYSGLLGIVLMAILFLFSFTKLERLLSPRVWWRLQYLGARTAFIAIVLHTMLLRWSTWQTWLSKWILRQDVGLPPMALLTVVFAWYVILVRLIERYSVKEHVKKKLLWLTVATSTLLIAYFF